MLVHYLQ